MKTAKELIEVLGSAELQMIRAEIRNLLDIRAWAVKKACNFREGDKVRITGDLQIVRNSGWWAYRECLAPGAVGVVRHIKFSTTGDWYAEVLLDREWAVSNVGDEEVRYWHGPVAETPLGFREPSLYDQQNHPEGRKGFFMIPVKRLERAPVKKRRQPSDDEARTQYLIDFMAERGVLGPDNAFTFPDGETWRPSRDAE